MDDAILAQFVIFCNFCIVDRMARVCSICGRGAMNSQTRSHSNIATKKKQHLNLQTLLHDGARVKACASCIRTATKRLNALAAA
ncbi:MAG: 50S ribosomal protein L28 [Candidatus Kerfeldbacteria bacterium]|nr:50S ribosomal protein L28 [Candidatus Kerfeldbacteria bacterium]